MNATEFNFWHCNRSSSSEAKVEKFCADSMVNNLSVAAQIAPPFIRSKGAPSLAAPSGNSASEKMSLKNQGSLIAIL